MGSKGFKFNVARKADNRHRYRGTLGYIKHGQDGILVRPNDPLALRESIETLLNDREMIRSIAIKAQQKAKSFSTEEHFKKIVSIAKEIIESKK